MPIKVDGELIPDSAVEYEFRRLVTFYSEHMPPSKVREQLKTLRRRAADQAIGAKLLMKQAERLNLPVNDADVAERMAELVTQAGGDAAFAAMLKAQKLTITMVRAGIERGRRVDMLVEKITADAPEPNEKEILEHFEANRDEYIRSDRAQAQHILIQADAAKPADMARAKKRLGEIRKQIEGGADFSELAAAHSDCPSGRKSGGSLGWFDKGTMVPEFDAVVFAMEVGRLSEIVETKFGVHLIYKIAAEPGGPAEFVDVRDKIRDFMRHARRGEALSSYVNELKTKAVIEGV